MLAHLLHLQGIDSVVLEARSRDYVEHRVRAGVLEQPTVDLLHEVGLGERLDRRGPDASTASTLRFDGDAHRIDFADLTGSGDHGLRAAGGREGPHRGAARRRPARALRGRRRGASTASTPTAPRDVHHRRTAQRPRGRRRRRLRRVPRGLPSGHRETAARRSNATYPFAWLGILAAYAIRRRRNSSTPATTTASRCTACGLPTVTRQYLQVAAGRGPRPTGRTSGSGHELSTPAARRGRLRAGGRRDLREGRHADAQLRRRADAARAAVPRRRRRPHRAAHRRQGHEPRDRRRLRAQPTRSAPSTPDRDPTTGSAPTPTTCLRRVWRAEHFSWFMTSMLHRLDRTGTRSSAGCSSRSSTTSRRRGRRRPRSPRTTSACRSPRDGPSAMSRRERQGSR